MAESKLKAIPTLAKPTIDGQTIKATWKLPKDSGYGGIKVRWTLDNKNAKGVKDLHKTEKASSATATSDTTSAFKKSDYYPNSSKKLLAVSAEVWGYKDGKSSDPAKSTKKVGKPKPPSIDTPTLDVATGTVSTTIKPNANTKSMKIYTDTQWTRTVNRNFGGKVADVSGTTTSDKGVGYDETLSKSLTYDQYSEVVWTAVNRGPKGKSKAVAKRKVIAHPAIPEITSVSLSGSGVNALVLVSLKTKKSDYHPTEAVSLQRIKNVQDGLTALQVASLDEWTDVDGASDDAQCKGLTDSATNATSQNGKRTWYRVKATACGYTQYSEPVEASELFKSAPTAADDHVDIVSVEPMEDGTSAKVVIGWQTDDSTGSELTWSDSPYAWQSNEKPDSMEVTWSDVRPSGYDHGASVYVVGLKEGVKYYFRARRYLDDPETGERSVGEWSAEADTIPCSVPQSLVVSLPSYVVRGKEVPVGWSMVSNVPQRRFAVYKAGSGNAVASGESSRMSAVLPASVYGSADSFSVTVRASTSETGNGWAESNVATTRIVSAPTVSMGLVPPTVTPDDSAWYAAKSAELPHQVVGAQGAVVNATGSADVIIRVVADGCAFEAPDGSGSQAEDEVLYSVRVGAGSTSTTLPALDFKDMCNYSVTAQAVDDETKLTSAAVEVPLSILWAHQAKPPTASVTLSEGSAVVAVTAPQGAKAGDVCDVYRVSKDRPYLIAQGVAFGTAVVDSYPPYSSEGEPMAYRVVTRTEDGDIEWTDAEFEHYGDKVRIDWNDASGRDFVELAYNLEFTPAIAKEFEERTHIDGTVTGYWRRGVSMTVPVSAENLRTESDQEQRLMRLARHVGPVFVRLPNGLAFPADAQVAGEGFGTDGIVAVSLNITRVGMTEEWMA